ncbi:hypothetical protein VTK56DRAFT_2218 [Thermocarpiscus australiensis]
MSMPWIDVGSAARVAEWIRGLCVGVSFFLAPLDGPYESNVIPLAPSEAMNGSSDGGGICTFGNRAQPYKNRASTPVESVLDPLRCPASRYAVEHPPRGSMRSCADGLSQPNTTSVIVVLKLDTIKLWTMPMHRYGDCSAVPCLSAKAEVDRQTTTTVCVYTFLWLKSATAITCKTKFNTRRKKGRKRKKELPLSHLGSRKSPFLFLGPSQRTGYERLLYDTL